MLLVEFLELVNEKAPNLLLGAALGAPLVGFLLGWMLGGRKYIAQAWRYMAFYYLLCALYTGVLWAIGDHRPSGLAFAFLIPGGVVLGVGLLVMGKQRRPLEKVRVEQPSRPQPSEEHAARAV